MSRIIKAIQKAQTQHRYPVRGPAVDRSHRQADLAAQQIERKPHDSGVFRTLARHVVPLDNSHLREKRVIAASNQDDRVGPYRQLRTQLLKTMQDNRWQTLAITSAHVGAGKTLTSANLAISMSRNSATTVLLVDLDLETPTTHHVLNLDSDKGLVDYLEGRAELGEILFNPGLERLAVLVGRSAGKKASELLATPRMQHLIHDLCHQDENNITIFDLPPLLRNDDAVLFAPFADATLVVVEDGVTTEDQLRESMRLLEKANVIGTILNKARI